MVSVQFLAVPITFLPAMGVLWLLLDRYEGYFEHRKVFFVLVVGFFAGIVLAAFENIAFRFHQVDVILEFGLPPMFVAFVFGYGLIESAGKLVVLGSGKYRMRKDTPYYGAALGVGLGAMLMLQVIALDFRAKGMQDVSASSAWWMAYLLAAVLGVGMVLVHGASGVLIGQAAAQGRLWKGLLWGTLLQAPALLLLWFWHLATQEATPRTAGGAALLAAVYGFTVVVLVQRRILDTIVPQEIRDMVRRDRRRQKRGKGKAGQALVAQEQAPGARDDGPVSAGPNATSAAAVPAPSEDSPPKAPPSGAGKT